MQRARILTSLVVSAFFVAFESSAWAFQRMLVPPVTTVSIPAFSRTEIPAFCVDSEASAPTTGDSFVKVFNAGNPEAVVVEAGGKSVVLEEAIGKGMVSVIGVSEPDKEGEMLHVRFDAVRVNPLLFCFLSTICHLFPDLLLWIRPTGKKASLSGGHFRAMASGHAAQHISSCSPRASAMLTNWS